MEQLELRKYARAEIAEVLSINLKDSRHFKRNVERKLTKWGYSYEYTTQAVTITVKPETAQARFSEILYRSFGMDIQVDALQVACFLAAFTDIDGFGTMPWDERAQPYYDKYGVWVEGRTMRNWCHQFIEKKIIAVSGESVAWKTTIVDHKKHRERQLLEEPNEIWDYYDRLSEIYKEEYQMELVGTTFRNESPKVASKLAWKETYKRLWSEFQCCYYYCKCFALSAFSECYGSDLHEVYELASEIANEAAMQTETRKKLCIENDKKPNPKGFVF